MNKSCDQCENWIKIKSLSHIRGICDVLDLKAEGDNGHNCESFRRGSTKKIKLIEVLEGEIK